MVAGDTVDNRTHASAQAQTGTARARDMAKGVRREGGVAGNHRSMTVVRARSPSISRFDTARTVSRLSLAWCIPSTNQGNWIYTSWLVEIRIGRG